MLARRLGELRERARKENRSGRWAARSCWRFQDGAQYPQAWDNLPELAELRKRGYGARPASRAAGRRGFRE